MANIPWLPEQPDNEGRVRMQKVDAHEAGVGRYETAAYEALRQRFAKVWMSGYHQALDDAENPVPGPVLNPYGDL